jgi:CrcB protein
MLRASAGPPSALARYAAVAIGGALGTLARYGQGAILGVGANGFAWGTFSINLLGSVLLALFLSSLQETARAHPLWRPLFAVGFCGGYTTFSSLEWETLNAARNGHALVSIVYVLASLGLGLSLAFLAWHTSRGVRVRRRLILRTPSVLLVGILGAAGVAAIVAAVAVEREIPTEGLAVSCGAAAFGGMIGSMSRYWVGAVIASRTSAFFPWGTFFINVTGSFAIGFYFGAAGRLGTTSEFPKLLVVTGWCGGYTTFSSFVHETLALAREGNRRGAAWNAIGSVTLGFAAVALGFWAGGV